MNFIEKELTATSDGGIPPRILLVGSYMWPWYQEACADALESLGCKVERFGSLEYFWHWRDGFSEPIYHSFLHRIQYRFQVGPSVWRVNRRLLKIAKEFCPDIVWFYNELLISPAMVKKLRKVLPNAVFVQYANDDPFSTKARPGLWRNFLNSISLFDIHFCYRHSNFVDYNRYGSRAVHLLRSYFIPEVDFPEPCCSIPAHFRCDVVFAGHYEDDGRVEMLEAILGAGYNLNVFGGGWDSALPHLRRDSPLRDKYPIRPAVGDAYRNAICGAKVALCFLSTLNSDTYTRRNFQIPAMKIVMLSQYTDDLASLFIPDVEMVYFKDQVELLNKLSVLIGDDALRESIAVAGYNKVYFAGHDVRSRMKNWLDIVSNFEKEI